MKFKALRSITEQVSNLIENSSSNVSAPEWNSGTPVGDIDTAHMYPEKTANLDKLNINFILFNLLKKTQLNDVIKSKQIDNINFYKFDIPIKSFFEIYTFFTDIINDISIEDLLIKCTIKVKEIK